MKTAVKAAAKAVAKAVAKAAAKAAVKAAAKAAAKAAGAHRASVEAERGELGLGERLIGLCAQLGVEAAALGAALEVEEAHGAPTVPGAARDLALRPLSGRQPEGEQLLVELRERVRLDDEEPFDAGRRGCAVVARGERRVRIFARAVLGLHRLQERQRRVGLADQRVQPAPVHARLVRKGQLAGVRQKRLVERLGIQSVWSPALSARRVYAVAVAALGVLERPKLSRTLVDGRREVKEYRRLLEKQQHRLGRAALAQMLHKGLLEAAHLLIVQRLAVALAHVRVEALPPRPLDNLLQAQRGEPAVHRPARRLDRLQIALPRVLLRAGLRERLRVGMHLLQTLAACQRQSRARSGCHRHCGRRTAAKQAARGVGRDGGCVVAHVGTELLRDTLDHRRRHRRLVHPRAHCDSEGLVGCHARHRRRGHEPLGRMRGGGHSSRGTGRSAGRSGCRGGAGRGGSTRLSTRLSARCSARRPVGR